MGRLKTVDAMRDRIFTRLLNDDKTKRYDVVIRIGGNKQVKKTFKTLEAAKEWRDRQSTDVNDGSFKKLRKGDFEAYAKQWLDTYPARNDEKELTPATLNGYASIIEKHLIPAFGHHALASITKPQIVEFRAGLVKERKEPRTVRNIMRRLKGILDTALEEGYLRVSPCPKLGKISKQQSGRAVTPAEFDALLAVCDEHLRLMVYLALFAGVRRGELFALRYSDIDTAKKEIHVRRQVFFRYGKYQTRNEDEPAYVFILPKYNSVRSVPLSNELAVELQQYSYKPDDNGLIFRTSNGGPVDPNNVCRAIPEDWECNDATNFYTNQLTKAVKVAGIPHTGFHDFRHTYGSVQRDQRTDYFDIMRWMGHKSIQVTMDIYGHPVTDRGQEASAKFDGYYFPKKK